MPSKGRPKKEEKKKKKTLSQQTEHEKPAYQAHVALRAGPPLLSCPASTLPGHESSIPYATVSLAELR